MTLAPLDQRFIITNADSWEPDAVLDLQRRLHTLIRRTERFDRAVRVTLQHEHHADPAQAFRVSIHLDTRGRTIHAHANGQSEYHASAELEQRLRTVLEHERERRWWARHHDGLGTQVRRRGNQHRPR